MSFNLNYKSPVARGDPLIYMTKTSPSLYLSLTTRSTHYVGRGSTSTQLLVDL